MNHKNGFNPLSRTTAHRRAMSRNMVTSLFRFERITTTSAKAKEVRKAAEKLITRSKVDTVHNRRIAAKFIQDEKILNKLFTELGPRMKDRKGGYTRILKIGFRQGDAADMVILELVDYKLPTEESKEKAAKKAEKRKEKKGIYREKVLEASQTNTRSMTGNSGMTASEKEEKIRKAKEAMASKEGSIASKAKLVNEYNKKNDKR